jgi:CubicO group peptidase (beta-lactamase class C family)
MTFSPGRRTALLRTGAAALGLAAVRMPFGALAATAGGDAASSQWDAPIAAAMRQDHIPGLAMALVRGGPG